MRPHVRRVIGGAGTLALSLSGAITAAVLAPAPARAATGCEGLTAPIYHRDNTVTDTSLLTIFSAESSEAAARYGFTEDHAVAGFGAATAVPGTVAVHRLYRSGGDFTWAIAGSAAYAAAIPDGYRDEGVGFYALPATGAPSCAVPVMVFTKGSSHRFAVSAGERDALSSSGWTSSGTAFSLAATDGAGGPVVPTTCEGLTTPVYHRDSPTLETSLLTTSKGESDAAGARYGFSQDFGADITAATTAVPGAVAVRRLYRSGGRFDWAVADSASYRAAIADGYVDEGTGFYALPVSGAPSCSVPVLEFTKGADHRFAVTAEQQNLLRAAGWRAAGAAFNAAPGHAGPPPAPVPPAPVPPAPVPPAPVPPPAPADPTTFTFAELPDTQRETHQGVNGPVFPDQTAWLAAHKSALNLKFVGHDGDVVDWGWLDHTQLTVASNALRTLEDAGIPYALAIGNHDTRAVGWNGVAGSSGYGGAAFSGSPLCVPMLGAANCNTHLLLRHTEEFNSVFNAGRETSVAGQFEPGKVDNEFSRFTAGGTSWLVLTLEFCPRASVVAWAKEVVASHPHDNVIVQTHYYLNGDGSIGAGNEGYGDTSPQYLWNNLIKVYPNIKLVFSGHVGVAASRTDVGVNGNKIVSFLQTMHEGSTDPIRLTRIDTATGTITTRIYAPYTDRTWPAYTATFTGLSFVS